MQVRRTGSWWVSLQMPRCLLTMFFFVLFVFSFFFSKNIWYKYTFNYPWDTHLFYSYFHFLFQEHVRQSTVRLPTSRIRPCPFSVWAARRCFFSLGWDCRFIIESEDRDQICPIFCGFWRFFFDPNFFSSQKNTLAHVTWVFRMPALKSSAGLRPYALPEKWHHWWQVRAPGCGRWVNLWGKVKFAIWCFWEGNGFESDPPTEGFTQHLGIYFEEHVNLFVQNRSCKWVGENMGRWADFGGPRRFECNSEGFLITWFELRAITRRMREKQLGREGPRTGPL